MIVTSLALLSGMVLFSSAASTPTHYVIVRNDTAGLLYDPPYIVSQPSSVRQASLSERRAWRRCLVQVPSQEPHCDPVPGPPRPSLLTWHSLFTITIDYCTRVQYWISRTL